MCLYVGCHEFGPGLCNSMAFRARRTEYGCLLELFIGAVQVGLDRAQVERYGLPTEVAAEFAERLAAEGPDRVPTQPAPRGLHSIAFDDQDMGVRCTLYFDYPLDEGVQWLVARKAGAGEMVDFTPTEAAALADYIMQTLHAGQGPG